MKIIKGEKHFTASVWVLTKIKPQKLLLVHHKKYNKWIQPGGHIEKFENPIETAIREIKEETGVDINFINKFTRSTEGNVSMFLKTPDFLIEQKIPRFGREPEHFHLDLQYVVNVEKTLLFKNNNLGWFTKSEALKLKIHEDTRLIISKLLE